MSTPLELGLFAVLAALLVVVSAIAGASYQKARSVPALRATLLARDLVERLRVLEALIERLDLLDAARARATPPARVEAAPTASDRAPRPVPALRVDVPGPPDEPARPPGPTLIAVPDLSARPVESAEAEVEAELAQRFGAIWALADAGQSAEAIFRSTGLPIGQVELILGLRRRNAATARRD